MDVIERGELIAAASTLPVERCPLCKAPVSAAVAREEPPNWVLCQACGLIYRPRVPSPEFIQGYYAQDYRDPAYPTLHDRVIQLQRAERSIDYLKGHGVQKVRRALDYGCASGVILDELRAEYRCEVVGVELNDLDKKIAQGRDIRVYGTLEAAPGKFDLVILTHVIEHLTNPVEFMEEMGQRVESKGAILFEVPAPIAEGAWAPFHMTVWDPKLFPSLLIHSGWIPVDVAVINRGLSFQALGVRR